MTVDEFLSRLDAKSASRADQKIRMAWGRSIQRQREALKMSRRQLAESVGVSVQAVAKWEDGSSAPRPSYQVAISQVLGVAHDILFRVGA